MRDQSQKCSMVDGVDEFALQVRCAGNCKCATLPVSNKGVTKQGGSATRVIQQRAESETQGWIVMNYFQHVLISYVRESS
jgi:hypothetical protein